MSDATTVDAGELGKGDDPSTTRRVYLVVREGDRTQVIGLDDGADVLFGRSPEATVRLDDSKASREHARFRRQEGVVRVIDLGSRNGTRLNDETVRGESRRVRSGDLVQIGAAEILVAETAGPASQTRSVPGKVDAELPGVVVGDPAMVKVFELVRKVAAAPTTVLILGETGVGKEVIAEQIHRQSKRADKPFVRLNCGAFPETLLESELFGHEKGAFTGADRRKLGYIETAVGGTLFLDEIGEMPVAMQTRLLRVLEARKLTRVGGREEIDADVRVIAATNRDLAEEVKAARFRQDLYFRLSAFVIKVPPLRERTAELELLAELFARQLAKRMGVPTPRISTPAMQLLRRHRWPGNVRELRNAIEHAVVVAEGGAIDAEQLPDTVRDAGEAPGPEGPMRAQLADLEWKKIQEALDAEGGNQTRAAKRLGISRRALQYKLEKYRDR